MKIGIAGIGCVGSALQYDFNEKGIEVIPYDKYKFDGIGEIGDLCECNIIFLCLPTPYDEDIKEYNKDSLYEVCSELSKHSYKGLVVIKSTVEPETTTKFCDLYALNIVHNPEFLSAISAREDFKNQSHIVIGLPPKLNKEDVIPLVGFYRQYYEKARISILTSTESELMKLGVNSFYSVKIQFFNELYILSNKLGISYEDIKNTMLMNGWINPMHTSVPGTDGKLSYGGMCFPKDTNALNEFMKRNGTPNMVLNSSIEERDIIRGWPVNLYGDTETKKYKVVDNLDVSGI